MSRSSLTSRIFIGILFTSQIEMTFQEEFVAHHECYIWYMHIPEQQRVDLNLLLDEPREEANVLIVRCITTGHGNKGQL